MSDWLNEIEASNCPNSKRKCDQDRERMARVIRELAEIVMQADTPVEGCHCGDCTAMRNLSLDAKELLKCSDG